MSKKENELFLDMLRFGDQTVRFRGVANIRKWLSDWYGTASPQIPQGVAERPEHWSLILFEGIILPHALARGSVVLYSGHMSAKTKKSTLRATKDNDPMFVVREIDEETGTVEDLFGSYVIAHPRGRSSLLVRVKPRSHEYQYVHVRVEGEVFLSETCNSY